MPECTSLNWATKKNICPPAKAEVIVWQINWHHSQPARFENYLTSNEIAHAQQFKSTSDQQNYTFRRTALRIILGQALNLPPNEVVLKTTALGKPYCPPQKPRPQLNFNVTGRNTHALIAITSDYEIGVDLEFKTTGLAREIASHAFTENEQHIIANSPDPDLQTTRFWARKEAYLKARGLGLNAEPHTCDVADITKPLAVATDGTFWSIVDLPDPLPDTAAALCIKSKNPPPQLSLYTFPTDYFQIPASAANP